MLLMTFLHPTASSLDGLDRRGRSSVDPSVRHQRQATRAILLARATIANMRGFLSSMRPSQVSFDACLAAALAAELAPMMSNRRNVASPAFVILPSRSLPPLDRCNGVSPTQAAKSRPRLNVSGAGARA